VDYPDRPVVLSDSRVGGRSGVGGRVGCNCSRTRRWSSVVTGRQMGGRPLWGRQTQGRCSNQGGGFKSTRRRRRVCRVWPELRRKGQTQIMIPRKSNAGQDTHPILEKGVKVLWHFFRLTSKTKSQLQFHGFPSCKETQHKTKKTHLKEYFGGGEKLKG